MGCTASAQKANTRPASPKDTPAVAKVETVEGNGEVAAADKVEEVSVEPASPDVAPNDAPADEVTEPAVDTPADGVAGPAVDTPADGGCADATLKGEPMEVKEIEQEDEVGGKADEELATTAVEGTETTASEAVEETAVVESVEPVAENPSVPDAPVVNDTGDVVAEEESNIPSEPPAPSNDTEAVDAPEVEEVNVEDPPAAGETDVTETEQAAAPAEEQPVSDAVTDDTAKEPEVANPEAEKATETTEESPAEAPAEG